MLTNEQLATRRGVLTATDATKITGLSKYGGAVDVQLDKAGVSEPFVDTDRVKWGNILEDPIRLDYAARHGIAVLEPGTLIHPDEQWAAATPDGIVVDPGMYRPEIGLHQMQPSHGWECKTHTVWLAHEYGEPGTDEVPPAELVQCAWNIWVARAYYRAPIERWDLTVFLDGLPTDFVITRDEELEATLVETGRVFWQDHIVCRKPIPADGSASYSKQLARKWERHDEEIMEATPELAQVADELREVRAEIKGREREEERLVQIIKGAIGAHSGISFPGNGDKLERITWRRSKDSARTDWKAVAAEYRKLAAEQWEDRFLDELAAEQTTIKPGSRRFVVPRAWNK